MMIPSPVIECGDNAQRVAQWPLSCDAQHGHAHHHRSAFKRTTIVEINAAEDTEIFKGTPTFIGVINCASLRLAQIGLLASGDVGG
jgi:hypothetical protein